MVAYTTTYNLAKPTVGDDEDLWGGYLNGNFDKLENLLKGTTSLTAINVTGNITVGGTVDGVDIATFKTSYDSHTHDFNDLTNKTSGTGEYSTSSHLTSGRGSGGVSLTINDGYGNANVTFNHKSGTPEQNGKSARIVVNTDTTTADAGSMSFQLGSGTSGVTASLTEHMRLTETGDLLVGTTDTTPYNNNAGTDADQGFVVNDGRIFAATNANSVSILNRTSTDGDIIEFRKDGTTVGNIGVVNTDNLYVGTPLVQLKFSDDEDNIIPSTGSGTAIDATIDLGTSGNRFKDLHLSGDISDGTTSLAVSDIVNTQTIARRLGWEPAYGNASESTVYYDATEDAVVSYHATDASIGAAFRAIRVANGETVRFTITLKGETATTAGLFLRLYQHNGALPDGKTHVSHNATDSSAFVQEDDTGVTNWVSSQAVPTTWTTYEYDYTATADGYVSLVLLNWTDAGTQKIWFKQPDIQKKTTTVAGNAVLTTADYDVQVCHLKTNVDASVTQGSANEFTVNFNLEEHNDTSTFSHSSGVVTVATAGWYRIVANLVYQNASSSVRNTIRAYVKKNGTEIPSTATYDYDRGTSYGEFSNNKINTMLYLAANDTIEIANYGQNIDGSVTIESAECEFMVSSETVQASSTNADTVDGLHASSFALKEADADLDMNNFDIYGVDQIFHHGDTNTYIQFHAADQFRVVTGGSERFEVNNTRTQADRFLSSAAIGETRVLSSGTSVTCDPDSGGSFSLTMTGNTTFTFGAPALGSVSTGFIIELTGNGSTVTWPTSVEWAGGTAPDAPASGETDIYVFWTRDAGTTWYGVQSIDAAA